MTLSGDPEKEATMESISDVGTTTVADAVARRLAEAGVRRAFGVPGGGSTSLLLAALDRAGIEFHLAHTETAAAFMASVESELTGKSGVVLATLGPGAASLVNGLAHCALDRVPVLAITDRLGQAADLPGYHQRLDHPNLLSEVVKESLTLTSSGVSAAVDHALARASSHPPGPVHLDLPVDVVRSPAREGHERPVSVRPAQQVPAPVLDRARKLLTEAERPVIVAGLGLRSVGSPGLEKVAHALRAPVLTTYKAKGAIDERDPWSAGIVTGGHAERALIDRADVLLSVGLDGVELIVGDRIDTPRVAISASPEAPGPMAPPQAQVVGDLTATLGDLSVTGRSKWTQEDAQSHRGKVDAAFAACAATGGRGLHPWTAASAIADRLGSEAALTVDAGAHMFPATQAWKASEPKRFWISNGLSTMGYALPAAVALSVNQPDLPVVCLSGDGGVLMAAGELATAARLGKRLLVVVFDDSSLSLIKIKQTEGAARAGLDFASPDWVGLARGFGLVSFGVDTPEGLRDALDKALDQPRPALISVSIDPTPYKGMMYVLRGS